mgnify:CR=1 FL=1
MKLLRYLVPGTFRSGGKLRTTLQLIKNMLFTYGWWKSYSKRACLDKDGNPIPWITYPCIDFLSQFDFSGKSIFEYGGGYSTLFWSKRAERIVSVESDKAWYDFIKPKMPANCELLYSSDAPKEYAGQIGKYQKFDVIVIDGPGATRPVCAQIAAQHLAPGGMVILDNSDLWQKSASILRANPDFIQVDFTGFTPLSGNASTTSIFLRRDSQLRPLNGHQPHKSVAQPGEPWGDA